MRIAADVAFATIDAGRLQGPVSVALLLADGGRFVEVVAKEDIDVHEAMWTTLTGSHLIEQLRTNNGAPWVGPLRNRPGAENRFGDRVIGRQLVLGPSCRPALGKNFLGRFEEYIGVDQRSAPKTRGQDGIDVLAVTDV